MKIKSSWIIDLNDEDKLWLKSCYHIFQSDSEIKLRELKIKLIDKIPADYSPNKLKKAGLLYNDIRISLLGILNIESDTKYYNQAISLIATIKNHIISNPSTERIEAKDLVRGTKLSTIEILKTLILIKDIGEFSNGHSYNENRISSISVDSDEVFEQYLQYSNIDDLIDEYVEKHLKEESHEVFTTDILLSDPDDQLDLRIIERFNFNSNDIWNSIAREYEIDYTLFLEKIYFINSNYIKDIIMRDIGHSFILAKMGLSKPAVILAGGVIEVLLETYLDHHGKKGSSSSFNEYIETCEDEGFLKSAIGHLSHYVRHFRNYVHLPKEKSERHKISKATAIGAVSSIFTIINDF